MCTSHIGIYIVYVLLGFFRIYSFTHNNKQITKQKKNQNKTLFLALFAQNVWIIRLGNVVYLLNNHFHAVLFKDANKKCRLYCGSFKKTSFTSARQKGKGMARAAEVASLSKLTFRRCRVAFSSSLHVSYTRWRAQGCINRYSICRYAAPENTSTH